MFGPWIQMWSWVSQRYPRTVFKKPKLGFIALHYLYIISCIIVGSILIFVTGGVPYVDALFFASGAATQSGLNTIDINNLKTFQQVVLYLMAWIDNPMFINSFVVFVRLYWFEKRFQNIVKDAHRRRRLGSRSRTQSRDERELDREERGVRGRAITVLRGERADPPGSSTTGSKAAEKAASEPEAELGSPAGSSSAGTDNAADVEAVPRLSISPPTHPVVPFRREITFADEVRPNDAETAASARLPSARSAEHHIAVLENQRNPKDKSTLWIPGPREFDRGEKPQTLPDGDEGAELSKQRTSATEPSHERAESAIRALEAMAELNLDDHPPKRSITIDEPILPRAKSTENHLPGLKLRRPGSLATPSWGRTILAAPTRVATSLSLRNASSNREPMPYLSWTPTIGRNSLFIDLTEDQREELGGIEYRALKTLARILVAYIFLFNLLGVVCLLPWIVRSNEYGPVADKNGQSRAWWGIFTPASMFHNLGFTITADSMISFQRAALPMLLGSFLIVVGNTGFPCMLRLLIWLGSHLVPHTTQIWEELKFLLDHPRRCFTMMFPGDTTWWLFWILVILNGVDVIFFVILDLQASAVKDLPVSVRLMDGLFQATATRTAGLACVNIAMLHPAMQVSYMVMMYISVFPIAISIRKTNVYEERSLGLYGQADNDSANEQPPSYTGAHLRKQLSFDLWYIAIGLFLIAVIEGARIENINDYAFTTFSVLFEVMSAYCNVGLSMGYPTINASFAGEFKTLSKLVIVAMQIRGKHRGLPYALDRAILLPSEALQQREEQEARNRMARRNSDLSGVGPVRADSIPDASPEPIVNGPGAVKAPSLGGEKSKPL